MPSAEEFRLLSATRAKEGASSKGANADFIGYSPAKQEKIAERSMVAGTAGTILGAIVGTYFGGPKGGAIGAAAGGKAGRGFGAASAGDREGIKRAITPDESTAKAFGGYVGSKITESASTTEDADGEEVEVKDTETVGLSKSPDDMSDEELLAAGVPLKDQQRFRAALLEFRKRRVK
jgi:hypothetical protein